MRARVLVQQSLKAVLPGIQKGQASRHDEYSSPILSLYLLCRPQQATEVFISSFLPTRIVLVYTGNYVDDHFTMVVGGGGKIKTRVFAYDHWSYQLCVPDRCLISSRI